MNPGPDDDLGPDDDPALFEPGLDEDGPDSGSAWVHEEIQRRIAAGRQASKGRHSRHEVASSTTSISYVPRHSTATPGPGALPPAPVATPARGIPRVETGWASAPPRAGAVRTPPPPPGGFRVVPPLEPVEPEVVEPGPEGHRRTMLAGG